MSPHSKILIADHVVPAIHAARGMALQDLNMMGLAGLERTEQQWGELLASAGLKLVKVWRSDDTKACYDRGETAARTFETVQP